MSKLDASSGKGAFLFQPEWFRMNKLKHHAPGVIVAWILRFFVVYVGNYNLPSLDATGLDVIIIGGGDTGVDCIGTSLRQVHYRAVT